MSASYTVSWQLNYNQPLSFFWEEISAVRLSQDERFPTLGIPDGILPTTCYMTGKFKKQHYMYFWAREQLRLISFNIQILKITIQSKNVTIALGNYTSISEFARNETLQTLSWADNPQYADVLAKFQSPWKNALQSVLTEYVKTLCQLKIATQIVNAYSKTETDEEYSTSRTSNIVEENDTLFKRQQKETLPSDYGTYKTVKLVLNIVTAEKTANFITKPSELTIEGFQIPATFTESQNKKWIQAFTNSAVKSITAKSDTLTVTIGNPIATSKSSTFYAQLTNWYATNTAVLQLLKQMFLQINNLILKNQSSEKYLDMVSQGAEVLLSVTNAMFDDADTVLTKPSSFEDFLAHS